jgi:hypothetical protein
LSHAARGLEESKAMYRSLFVRAIRLTPAALLAVPLATAAQQTSASAQPQITTAAPPAAAPQPQPQPQKLPLFNRANQKLPQWLKVRGEFRERVEGFQNLGFTEGRDDGYALSRVRLNVAVTPNKHFSFQANVHDARVGGKTVGPTTAPFRGPFDLRTAFADVGSSTAPVAARIGRQELAFGEQRLLGHLAWVNTGRAFDAARVTLRAKAFQLDVFGASIVRSLPDGFDKSGNGNRLVGAYATTGTLIPKGTFEPYVILRHDENLRSELGPFGSLEQTTIGARTAGRLPAGLDYGVEMAMQRGSLADDSISAWAGHWQIRESLPGKGAVKLTSEYNFASGDTNATDGTRATFDQLYPTGHDKLGLADQVGWRNIHHLREGFEFSPVKATPISVNYHSWWLAEKTDGLYNAGGARIAFVAGGAASRHVGQEIDVQVTRALTPQLQLAAGYAHMFTGKFLEQATPGASYSAPYIMATYVFLADK